MEGNKFQQEKIRVLLKCSKLLELAAADDLSRFVSDAEEQGIGVDEVGIWYGRRNSSDLKMGFEERTPLMIASTYGSNRVLKYLISTKKIGINKTSGTDGVTALHCAAAGGSPVSVEVVKLLIDAGADVTLTDANGNKPGDLIARGIKPPVRKGLEMLLNGFVVETKKEYPIDVPLPDINNELFGSDEFRMYTFKVKPCSRAYTHDWTECPFVHPGENARRRDLIKYSYSCVPCSEFRKGNCVHGDDCEYAHGVFESWLHPAQYKTRLCKDESSCARKVCFFAHRVNELRPLYVSTGSAIPSPRSGSVSSVESGSMSPMAHGSTPPMSPSVSLTNGWLNKMNHLTPPVLQLSGSRLRTGLNARDLELQSLRDQQQQRQLMIDTNLQRGKQRSQSFIDRSAAGAPFSQWGSPDGKLDWGFNGEDVNNKFRKSASFVFRNDVPVKVDHQADVSWVGVGMYSSSDRQRYGGGGGGDGEKLPQWVEQMLMEERLVA